ncbi:MAG TPA: barstar family protein [Mycobacteriales bacterium]
MVVNRLAVIVDGSRPPGLYRWRSRAHPAAIGRELTEAGIAHHVLDGARVYDAATLFDVCATALRFPDRFTGDWEGLADCLADLSWLHGRAQVLLWEHYGVLARRDPLTWQIAREVFGAGATVSGKDGPPLYVLLRGPGPAEGIPVL